MSAIDLRIEPKEEGKGRTFRAALLASVEADPIWDGGRTSGDVRRPVLAVLGGSDAELRPFVANLSTGRKALFGDGSGYRSRRDKSKLELLKSAGYEVFWQRYPEGAVATAFLPELFDLDPGMVDPTGARFVCLPRAEWVNDQALGSPHAVVSHAMRAFADYDFRKERGVDLYTLAAPAHLFAAMLDRRTRCPIVNDGRFYLQLLVAALRANLAVLPSEFDSYRSEKWLKCHDVAELGFATPIGFCASHAAVEELLSEQTSIYFDLVGRRGSREPATRGASARGEAAE